MNIGMGMSRQGWRNQVGGQLVFRITWRIMVGGGQEESEPIQRAGM